MSPLQSSNIGPCSEFDGSSGRKREHDERPKNTHGDPDICGEIVYCTCREMDGSEWRQTCQITHRQANLMNFRIRCSSPASGFGKMSAFHVASHSLQRMMQCQPESPAWPRKEMLCLTVDASKDHRSAFRFPPASMALTSSAVHLLIDIPLHLCWNSRCRPLHVMHTCQPPARVTFKRRASRTEEKSLPAC